MDQARTSGATEATRLLGPLADAPTRVGTDAPTMRVPVDADAATVTGPRQEPGGDDGVRVTGSFTRLSRTRTNTALPPDTQELDLRLQQSRPSVVADLGRAERGSIPPRMREQIAQHGTEGRYAIEKPLAQGGMGAVLLIQDGDFRRPAAMKVMLSRHTANPDAFARFLAEAQITARLEHPNIVPIHDLGVLDDGTVYFTMKYIEGESLGAVSKRLRSDDAQVRAAARAAWDDERILQTFLKVLDGMGYAHDRGVVHRDIKPDNLMIGAHGEVLVVDWGIAKELGAMAEGEGSGTAGEPAESGLTRDGTVMGTVYYMAPEQARGDLAAIGAWSDLYAIGASLYELLAGCRPVTGGPADILARVIAGDIAPIGQARPGIHQDLAAIVAKAMAVDPQRRYRRCQDMADDIRRYLAGQAVLARRRNAIERLGAWLSRHRRRVAAGAIAAGCAAAAALAGGWWHARNAAQRAADLAAQAQDAIAAGRWEEARERAAGAAVLRPGDASISALRDRALAGAAAAEERRLEQARAASDRQRAAGLAAQARSAAEQRRWQEALDAAKASLALAPLPEAQDILGRASAALADAQRAALEALAAQRKADGDRQLARVRSLAAGDPGVLPAIAAAREAYAQSAADGIAIAGIDEAVAELGALQAAALAAREAAVRAAEAEAAAARRAGEAAAAVAATEAAIARGDGEAAAAQVAIALRLAPGDERAVALRTEVALLQRAREAEIAAVAARDRARAAAAAAIAQARAAAGAMAAAVAERGRRAAEIAQAQGRLDAAGEHDLRRLSDLNGIIRGLDARIAEQWALAEGAARSAVDALAGEAGHADAVAARALLVELYRGRLAEARARQALPEIAAFENLLRRIGVDPQAGSATLALAGPPGVRVAISRLGEDARGRLRPVGDPVAAMVLPGEVALPAGRYELVAGDDRAALLLGDGVRAQLAWAPASRPGRAAGRVRWLPAGAGAWLGEREVTVAEYQAFLDDPRIAAEVRRAYAAWQAGRSEAMRLLPRQGAALDESVWQVAEVDGELRWRPVDGTGDEPVRGVSRADAEAYCAWLTARLGLRVRLPSLAEWRFAAHGGDDRRIHPWGPGFDYGLAASAVPPRAGPPAVGTAPDDRGPFGHLDLAGSVREWVADRGLAYDARIAGGGWTDEDPARLRSDAVEGLPSSATYNAIGFRILVEP